LNINFPIGDDAELFSRIFQEISRKFLENWRQAPEKFWKSRDKLLKFSFSNLKKSSKSHTKRRKTKHRKEKKS